MNSDEYFAISEFLLKEASHLFQESLLTKDFAKSQQIKDKLNFIENLKQSAHSQWKPAEFV